MKPLFGAGTPAHGAQAVVIDAPSMIITSTQPVQQYAVAPVQQTAVATFRVVTDDEIDKLGNNNSARAKTTGDKLLQSVKASDMDAFGGKLNELIAVAKGLDPNKLSKPGIIGRITSMFGSVKEKMLSELDSAEGRINSLTGEMTKSVTLFHNRIGDIENLYQENYQTYLAFGDEIKLAESLYGNLDAQLAAESVATDSFSAQRQGDIKNRIARCLKKIDDLKRGQQLCIMAAPELRIMQDNSRSLKQTFTDIQNVTIPAYMGVMRRYLLSIEQKKGAELATSVQDATNEAFRMQADQLRNNVQLIATAAQRSVVDIETLEHMQKQLIGAVDDMQKIAEAGAAARKAAAPKLVLMEQELVQRFAATPKQLTN